MEIRKPIANDDAPAMGAGAHEDHVQPFMLEASQLRGRIVRSQHVANAIIQAHHYPEPIARLLAEALCLTTLLAGMLKFDGVFTLQAKGDVKSDGKTAGIVQTLVCDITTSGVLRGYVGFDEDALKAAKKTDFADLLQGGYLAFTVDQADNTDRYQGIVALDGEDLTACVRNYFLQSEQIQTGFVSFVEKDENGAWVAAAMMLQQLAREGGIEGAENVFVHDGEAQEDDWRRAMVLMQTATAQEMLQRDLPLNDILYRLFHEEGVRVFDPIAIEKGCRCSEERIRNVLDSLSAEEKAEYVEDGVIHVTCEFCNTRYEFPIESI